MPSIAELQKQVDDLQVEFAQEIDDLTKKAQKEKAGLRKKIKALEKELSNSIANAEAFKEVEKHARNIVCAWMPPRNPTLLSDHITCLMNFLDMEYGEMRNPTDRP